MRNPRLMTYICPLAEGFYHFIRIEDSLKQGKSSHTYVTGNVRISVPPRKNARTSLKQLFSFYNAKNEVGQKM